MPDFQEIMRVIASKKKSSFPWKQQEPYPQPCFSYDNDSRSWLQSAVQNPTTPVASFEILSWNIDFMLPFADERMQAALDHLRTLTSRPSTPTPSIIFLNECLVSDLTLIQSQPWIQQGYTITDIDDQYWESGHYGTTTLISKSLAVKSVFRVHYEATRMERDALCVDIDAGNGKALRLCNSHLESLVADPPLRPHQVETAAKHMQAAEVYGAVVGGDFNAIQPFDRTLHSENGLKDAYLETGGEEGNAAGFTWGQMAAVKQREMFGLSRMDKLFFYGGLRVEEFERFGLGVRVGNDEIEKILKEKEDLERDWVTDHAGVRAVFRLVGAESKPEPVGSKI